MSRVLPHSSLLSWALMEALDKIGIMPILCLLLKFSLCFSQCRMLQISESSFLYWKEILSFQNSSKKSSSFPVFFELAHQGYNFGPTMMYATISYYSSSLEFMDLTFTVSTFWRLPQRSLTCNLLKHEVWK